MVKHDMILVELKIYSWTTFHVIRDGRSNLWKHQLNQVMTVSTKCLLLSKWVPCELKGAVLKG